MRNIVWAKPQWR